MNKFWKERDKERLKRELWNEGKWIIHENEERKKIENDINKYRKKERKKERNGK